MAFQPFPTDSPWTAILATSVRAPGVPPDARLFLEQREDVRLSWAEGRTSGSGTHWRGLCAEGPGSSRHISDPSEEDILWVLDPGSKRHPVRSSAIDARDPAGVDREALQAVVESLAHAVGLCGRGGTGIRASITAVAFEQHVWIAHREQGCLEDRRRSVRLRVEVERERGPRLASAVAEVARAAPRDIDAAVLSSLASRVVERLEARLDPRDVKPGDAIAVLAPGVGGVLAHEIVGHALEADRVVSGASWLAARSGKVAPPELLILDDPRRGRAPWRVDDEGIEPRATALIDGGHATGRLHDRRSAARSGSRPTGHGRRASFRDPVLPRMGCTYIAAGDSSATEVVSSVERGVYVRRMEAASVDARSGRAVFRVTDADEIVRGALAAPLLPFLCIVEGPRVLRAMHLVADDVAFDTCIGTCHRDGQALAIGVGAPTICIGVSAVSAENFDTIVQR